jgi:UDPglucose--hexose-1-phosphate uridylyltransferase
MGILRKDYILNRWVYFAIDRKNRHREFKEEEGISSPKSCFFCKGNEHLTPKEIGRVEHKGSWKIRWFPNKFPAVEKKGSYKTKTKKRFLTEGHNYGFHEVIADTNDHKKQLADLSVSHIKQLLEVYSLRIKTLSELKGVKYVSVFKNKGPQAGTSLVHSHTQVNTVPIIPEEITGKTDALKRFRRCPYCDIIKLESHSDRKIISNKNILAFTPFASRFNYEAWIFPKRHINNITSMNDDELYDTAAALKKLLLKLKKLNASYNFFLHYAPAVSDMHFHIELTPRLAKWGGFEISTGSTINSVLPEDAARFYKK